MYRKYPNREKRVYLEKLKGNEQIHKELVEHLNDRFTFGVGIDLKLEQVEFLERTGRIRYKFAKKNGVEITKRPVQNNTNILGNEVKAIPANKGREMIFERENEIINAMCDFMIEKSYVSDKE